MIKFDSLPPTIDNTRLTDSGLNMLFTRPDAEQFGWFAARLLIDNGANADTVSAIVETVFTPQIAARGLQRNIDPFFQASARAVRWMAPEVPHV
jgi:hypothetical protein